MAERTPPDLGPVADKVDRELIRIERDVNWLHALSPTGNSARWAAFQESGFKTAPALTYPSPNPALPKLRKELNDLPLSEIEHPLFEALLTEKAHEVDRQIEVVRLRNTEGMIPASLALFGSITQHLITVAKDILSLEPPDEHGEETCDVDDFVAAAEAEFALYREQCPGFQSNVVVEADLNSDVMVNHGTLYLSRDIRETPARMAALIAHEVGTHVLSAHNGRQQPLRQLAYGLADYDALQEGLGCLAEFLAGCLSLGRLRVLAARVVASSMATEECRMQEIFECLHDEHGIPAEDAFDTAVRARRGGGLTKDAVYLEGLSDLLDYLGKDGDIEFLFLGKFALGQAPVLRQLLKRELIRGPELLPRHIISNEGASRLQHARSTPVTGLYTRSDAP